MTSQAASGVVLVTSFSHDSRRAPGGTRFYSVGAGEHGGNIGAIALEDGSERPMTRFEARIGQLRWSSLTTDGSWLYLVWQENFGDIGTMDVVY